MSKKEIPVDMFFFELRNSLHVSSIAHILFSTKTFFPSRIVEFIKVCEAGLGLKAYRRVDKRYQRTYMYYYCPNGPTRACTHICRPKVDYIANAIAQHLHNLTPSDLAIHPSSMLNMASIKEEIRTIQKSLDRLNLAIAQSDTEVSDLLPLRDNLKNRKEIEEKKLAHYKSNHTAITDFDANRYTSVPGLDDYAGRERFNQDVARIVKAIRVDAEGKETILNIEYIHPGIPMHIISIGHDGAVISSFKQELSQEFPHSAGGMELGMKIRKITEV